MFVLFVCLFVFCNTNLRKYLEKVSELNNIFFLYGVLTEIEFSYLAIILFSACYTDLTLTCYKTTKLQRFRLYAKLGFVWSPRLFEIDMMGESKISIGFVVCPESPCAGRSGFRRD